MFVVQITSRTSVLLLLSDPFEKKIYKMVGTSTKIALSLDNICTLAIFTTTWAALNI